MQKSEVPRLKKIVETSSVFFSNRDNDSSSYNEENNEQAGNWKEINIYDYESIFRYSIF